MKRLLLLLPLFLTFYTFGQVNYTANSIVTPYNGKFRLGINPGYYPGWDNQKLANISAGNPAIGQKGVGARSNRVGLYENILDTYGYNVSMPDFLHYASLGMSENVAIIGGPSGAHQDYTQYCPGQPSALFSNLYEPIWDGGLNGTPYNDNNFFAAYMYKTVSQYKDHVRFWEIWNEPGLDVTFNIGWRDENYPGNWWKEGPKPCEYVLKAPIYNYIRTLRIAWEVIKTVAPDDYVCLGSVGYQSFMNALLSNTDNPNNGDVSAAFPLTGGAYFDCITYHSYPHFDGSTTFLSSNFFQRHSDEAADGLVKYQAYYQVILDRYGYNGSSFPKKEWIVTEINSPRKTFGEAFPGSGKGPFFGSVEAQINHIMKAFMVSKINKIHQLHTFELIDRKNDAEANYEFDLFGLYKTLNGAGPYNVQVNDEGKALKTMTDLVFDTEYDPVRTAALNLPSNVRGYAWKKPDGSYVYSLWAKTVNDLSENITANYTFPANLNVNSLVKHTWDYGYTGSTSNIPSQNIALDARPIFLLAGGGTAACAISAQVSNYQCNNNGTPTVVADDTYTFSVTVSNSTGCGSSWTGGGTTGSYGVAKTFGPYLISEGNKTLTFTDASNATATATVRADAPAPCSAIVVTCQNNILQNPGLESGLTAWEGKGEVGAPANSGTNALKVCLAGEKAFQTRTAQAGKTYRLDVIAKKDVNTEGVIGFKFLSSSFIPLLHIYQGIPTNEYFIISKTGTAPAGTAYVEVSLIKDTGLGCLFADDWCLSETSDTGGDPCANDTEAPKFTKPCPSNSTVSVPFPAPPYAEVGWEYLGVSDNCSKVVENVVPPTPYVRLNAGQSTTFVHTSTDGAGNTATCSYTITAVNNPCFSDNIPPQITCPPNVTVTAPTGEDSASVTLTLPTMSDNCNVIGSLKLSTLSGQEIVPANLVWKFPIGTTSLRWTVGDFRGNTASCTFNTTVTRQTTGGGADIGLTIAANPTTFKKWTNHSFIITAKNNSTTAFSNVSIQFKFPALTVAGGQATPSVGGWREWCAGGIQCFEWVIPTFAASETATLEVPVFILDANAPIVATTTLLTSTPVDANTANNTATVSLNATPAIANGALVLLKPTTLIPAVIQSIAPNPSEGDAVIGIESLIEKPLTITIYNSLGKILVSETRKVEKGNNALYFNMDNYPSGIYFIATEYQKTPVKFIKM